jgi:hypothetical protein
MLALKELTPLMCEEPAHQACAPDETSNIVLEHCTFLFIGDKPFCVIQICANCVTKRRKGETKEGGGKEAGNREAHAGNRADLATQADAEHRSVPTQLYVLLLTAGHRELVYRLGRFEVQFLSHKC